MIDKDVNTTTHPDYLIMLPALRRVRDAVKGSFFVKRKGVIYLPHPSEIDQTSDEAIARYYGFIAGAEFDEVPGQTMRSMIGRIKLHDSTVDLPERVSYLSQNVDNDGVSFLGQIEQVICNVLQVKWHLLVAEYVNAPLPGERLTPEEVAARKMRAAIKSYTRESVLDWDFQRINSVMQLRYLKLHQRLSRLDIGTGSRREYDEYLILALDDNGEYFYYKETLGADGSPVRTEPTYPTVNNGQRLRWLPVQIISDIEPNAGELPMELGFLSPIVEKSYARYIDSAYYADGRQNLLPTMTSSGWTNMAWELFPQMNFGRDYLITGKGVNNLPEGVTMDIVSPDSKLEHFVKYRQDNAEDIRALGGEFAGDASAANMSAAQAMNERSDKVSRLVTIVNNIENCYKRLALYCGMFEGIYSQDNIEDNLDDIGIKLNREFAKDPANIEAGRFIVTELLLSGLYSREHIIKLLISRGWSEETLDSILAQLDGGENLTL